MRLSAEEIRLALTTLVCCFIMISLSLYAWKKFLVLLQRPWSFRNLLKGFKAKMWMTFGLGIVFFSFYFLVIFISSVYLKEEKGELLFFSAYHSPKFFIYAGLLIFACFSLTIYLIRMLIKYLFLTRGKGD